MTADTDLLTRLVQLEDREKSNTHRLDNMEEQIKAVNALAQSVSVMAAEQKTMNVRLGEVVSDVRELKAEPVRRWKVLVEKVISVLAAAVLGFVLAKFGL